MLWLVLLFGLDLRFSILAMVVGSLLPDADTRKSLAGKFIPLWLVFKHRGFTHTVWSLLLLSGGVWYFFGLWWAESFAIGYISHLVADSTTKAGVKWF